FFVIDIFPRQHLASLVAKGIGGVRYSPNQTTLKCSRRTAVFFCGSLDEVSRCLLGDWLVWRHDDKRKHRTVSDLAALFGEVNTLRTGSGLENLLHFRPEPVL